MRLAPTAADEKEDEEGVKMALSKTPLAMGRTESPLARAMTESMVMTTTTAVANW
jgi:hypothetical protein